MKYFGVICCILDRSFSLTEVNTYFKPLTECVGLSGICKWYKSKQEQIQMIDYIKKLEYKENKKWK